MLLDGKIEKTHSSRWHHN